MVYDSIPTMTYLKKIRRSFLLLIRFFYTLSIVRLLNLIYHISHRKYLDSMTRVLYGFRIIQGKQFSAKRELRRSTFMQIVIQFFKITLPSKKHIMFIKKILQKWQFDIAFCMHLLCNLLHDMQRFSFK